MRRRHRAHASAQEASHAAYRPLSSDQLKIRNADISVTADPATTRKAVAAALVSVSAWLVAGLVNSPRASIHTFTDVPALVPAGTA
ncbi:hypothetical protein, partial [Nonomuraea sp. NPDC005650]|uniref:hypothetical protein n=1 Tax=Nonomuraea sp. NPDC005650 TaxID=3157045 RepID=UPI0033A714DD